MPYLGRSTDGFGIRDRFQFTAAGSETSISGSDNHGRTLKYSDGKYVDVYLNIRAKRRYKQLIDNGEKSIYLKILEDIKLRDKTDKTRKNSPLVVPRGAKIINNSHTFKKTIAQIRNIIEGIN